MGNKIDWNLLEKKVKGYVDTNVEMQDAFQLLMVSTILDISDEEAEDSITDGSHDRGIDAIYIDERDGKNSIHLFQFKYVTTFEKSKSNFPSSEIDKVSSFTRDVLDKNYDLENSCNPILWNKVKEIWVALDKPNACIEIHFCGNLLEMCPDEKNRANKTLTNNRHTNVHHHSLESIVLLLVDKKTVVLERSLQIVDKDYFDRSDGNVRGLICTVEAKEIIDLIQDPSDPKKVLVDIFNDNVRVYLDRSNRINGRIIETALSEQNPLFWYLNNGITITCDSFAYMKGSRAPKVQLENVQIVNGGQTSNALFEAYQQDPEKLGDVLVLVRVIETKSKDVSLSIAESTNSQTPIKSRDLRSNDITQKKLEEAFSGMGFYYERKLKQHQDKPKSQRIDALTAGQAHLAYGLDLPEVAKKDRGRIFADLYDQIFTDELTVDELYTSLQVLSLIEKEKKQVQHSIKTQMDFDKTKMFLIDGAYHVLFAVGQICERDSMSRLDFTYAKEQVHQAIKSVYEVAKREEDNNESFSFNRFFKDAKTKTKIIGHIQQKQEQSKLGLQ